MRCRAALLPCLLLGSLLASSGALCASPESLHRQAVEAARQGDYANAVDLLRRLVREHPEREGFLHDLAVVLSWSGDEHGAVELLPRISPYEAPRYVVAVLARSARNTGLPGISLDFYQALLQRWPDDEEGRIGLALTLASAGEYEAARARIAAFLRDHPDNLEGWRARAWINARAGDALRAAAAWREVLRRHPEDREALRGLVGSLRDLGAPQLALELLGQHPAAAGEELERVLQADLAAQTIRWGELPPPSPERRFEVTDRALGRLDAACRCDWERLDLSRPLNRRLLFDRMVALRDRVRMTEVEHHYRQLQEAGISLPDYALLAAGDALLYLRRPEEAGAIYRRVLERDPRNYNARLSLFYALVEQERHHEALALIDALAASEPVWRRTRDGRGRLQNPRRFTADLTAAMARAYADDLPAAQERLQALLELGPENTELQQELATVWRWRGWERRAYATYLRLLGQEPSLTGARIGAAAASLDLQRYREAEQRVTTLARKYPENLHVQRELRRWQLHNRPVFIAETGYGSSTGGTFGTEEWLGQFWIYSSPLRYNWRGFFHDRYEEAVFTEGTGHNHRPGVGLEYRREGLTLSGELSAGTADNGAVGLALDGLWRADDHWSLGAVAEMNSASMPLRGQHAGIRGHRLGLKAGYRWHESREAGATLDYMHMSDGNNRYALSGNLRQRLLTRPLWRIEGRLDAYASHNTLRGPIYYNPENDLSLEASLDTRWVMFRRYEQEFAHRLTLSGGGYWETGFPGDHTWALRYQHEWKFSDRFSLGLGYSRARRVYDGGVEFQTRYFGTLEVKL